MAPLGQGLIWSEVLCCPLCSQIFSSVRVPVNLLCGHAACLSCLHNKPSSCPSDSVKIPDDICDYPINTAILLILNVPLDAFLDNSLSEISQKSPNYEDICEVETYLYSLARYLRVADSERGGSVYSDLVSRTIQRKIITILCSAITHSDGRIQAMRAVRSLSERVVTELICVAQNTVHLSAFLWSAVRARGCQFLGPAMQEDVLKLILLTLVNGELIARKTLVMYIVQTLSEDYPHVSKTCVGHVVQLLYRASCFNVIKRDGESSLMQLKEEFREYESLRREHDSQIVQIALEAGLRITPDQWSALLYGDSHHRSHMQSIVDRLHSPQLLSHALNELKTIVERNSNAQQLQKTLDDLAIIAETDCEVEPGWKTLCESLGIISSVIDEYVAFNKKWNLNSAEYRYLKNKNGFIPRPGTNIKPVNERNGQLNNPNNFGRYKTRMCRDILSKGLCPRGTSCTYAHIYEELRPPHENDAKNDYHDNDDSVGNGFTSMQDMNGHVRMGMNEMNHIQQQEIISMPMIPIQSMQDQLIPENQPVVIDNTNGAYINVVPVVMHPQIGDINNEQFNKAPPTPMPPHQGIQGPIYMVPQQEIVVPHHPPPIVIPNPQVQMIRGPPPPIANHGGVYSYHIAPSQPLIQPHPSHIIYPAHNMWTPPPNQLFRPTDGFYATGLRNSHKTFERKDYNKTPDSKTASDKSSKQNWASCDEGSLLARRNEVVSRLMKMDISKDECEEDVEGHVSYTVANSVLFDDVEMFGANTWDFPPLPLQPLPNVPSSVSPAIITDAMGTSVAQWGYPITFEPRFAGSAFSVRTVCPTALLRLDSTKPATVQSDCSVMNVKDAIDQPLVTSAIQRNNLSPQESYDMVDPCQLTEQLPRVMKANALTPEDPQDFVSSSLDKIITVRGKINEEMGSSQSSAVEQEQLKVELNIANRQLSTLDQQTKQTCLLKELKAIDEKIENLGSNSADSP